MHPLPTRRTHPRLVRAATSPEVEHERWRGLATHARRAAGAILRLPADHADVEDSAQDALVALLESGLPRFDASLGTVEALLAVIARNAALTRVRRRATRARIGEQLRAEWPSSDERGHRRLEAATDLATVLDRLHPAHALALVAIDLEGERIGDAARRLGKTYSAVNAQIGHARASARRVAQELRAA